MSRKFCNLLLVISDLYPPIKEVHVQIMGAGRMQQHYENDLKTLYREDLWRRARHILPCMMRR